MNNGVGVRVLGGRPFLYTGRYGRGQRRRVCRSGGVERPSRGATRGGCAHEQVKRCRSRCNRGGGGPCVFGRGLSARRRDIASSPDRGVFGQSSVGRSGGDRRG